jgi:hypothetical protein
MLNEHFYFKTKFLYDLKCAKKRIKNTHSYFSEDSDLNYDLVLSKIKNKTFSNKKRNNLKYLILTNINWKTYSPSDIFYVLNCNFRQRGKIKKVYLLNENKKAFYTTENGKNFNFEKRTLIDIFYQKHKNIFAYIECDSKKTAKITYSFFNGLTVGFSKDVFDIRLINRINISHFEILGFADKSPFVYLPKDLYIKKKTINTRKSINRLEIKKEKEKCGYIYQKKNCFSKFLMNFPCFQNVFTLCIKNDFVESKNLEFLKTKKKLKLV